MAECGDIYLNSKMQYKDGEIGVKFLILLSIPQQAEVWLLVKTTSKQKSKTPGCNKEKKVFFLPAKSTFFPKDTWVQLHEFFEMNPESFQKNPDVSFRGKLKPKLIEALIQCLFLSSSEDISPHQEGLLRPSKAKGISMLEEKFGKKY